MVGHSVNQKRSSDAPVRKIRDAGFNPVDIGPLSAARYVEPFSLQVAQLAYNGSVGPELAYRFERF